MRGPRLEDEVFPAGIVFSVDLSKVSMVVVRDLYRDRLKPIVFLARGLGLAVCDAAWLRSGGACGRLVQYVAITAERKRLVLHVSDQFAAKFPAVVDVLVLVARKAARVAARAIEPYAAFFQVSREPPPEHPHPTLKCCWVGLDAEVRAERGRQVSVRSRAKATAKSAGTRHVPTLFFPGSPRPRDVGCRPQSGSR